MTITRITNYFTANLKNEMFIVYMKPRTPTSGKVRGERRITNSREICGFHTIALFLGTNSKQL